VSDAGTVDQAILALAQRPQWILLDLMLPDGSGIDVLRKVTSERLASKVCVVTGCAGELLNSARSAGAQYIFTKPLDIERLLMLLRSEPMAQ